MNLKFKILNTTAGIVSGLLSPVVLLLLLLFIVLPSPTLNKNEFISMFLLLFGLGILPILLTYLAFKLTGKISDWEIRDRKQRIPVYAVSLVIGWVMFYLLSFIMVDEFTEHFMSIILIWFTLHTLVTLFWKISAHTGGITLFCLILVLKYHLSSWFLILIPIVAWSRIYRKNHTFWQAVMGAGLASLVIGLIL